MGGGEVEGTRGEVGGEVGGEETEVVVVVVVVVSVGSKFVNWTSMEVGGGEVGRKGAGVAREEEGVAGSKEERRSMSSGRSCNCFKSCAVTSDDSNLAICSASSASKTGFPVMEGVVVTGVVGVASFCFWIWMGLMGCWRGTCGRIACVANFGKASDCARRFWGCARLVKKPSICARESESIASRQSCAISPISSTFSDTRFAGARSHASSASCAGGTGSGSCRQGTLTKFCTKLTPA